MLQFRLRRRCFRAPLVHLSALLMPPPPLSKPKGTAARSPSHMSPNFVSPANKDVVSSGGGSSTSATTSPTGQGGDKKIVASNPATTTPSVATDNVNTEVVVKEDEDEGDNIPNANTQSLPTSNTRLYSPQAQ
eukprot:TRINITY_DN55053_c0_g1_i1.p1 TRINITY_DN55053_c0_g1~~TRINITY_DN55053_c0_g1_i1.p1  ORF type:complete len:133 (-),score=13.10 TRINITY_DN55053_c0_g1_i1:236-634(-)